MSDTLPGTPGTGDVPEPESEGFRDEQIEAEEERRRQAQVDAAQRSTEAKAELSGENMAESAPAPKTAEPQRPS